jgi:hypothetical protein
MNNMSDNYDKALDDFEQRTYKKPEEYAPVTKTVTKTYTISLPSAHVEEVSEEWLKEMRKWLNNEFGDHTVITPPNPFPLFNVINSNGA